MKHTVIEIKEAILKALPEGKVVAKHTETAHFYSVDGSDPYPSVTGRLQILKDEGLINYKANRVADYMFAHYKEFTDATIMDHVEKAKNVSEGNLKDAAGIGTLIHDTRQTIFDQWIATGHKPPSFTALIPPVQQDIRAISAIRALEKFVIDYDYTPIACELFVYSHELRVAGTLDDLGIARRYIRKGHKDCAHELIQKEKYGKINCLKCDLKAVYEFTLMDLKSSNALKSHYFFQVALYWKMFTKLVGIKPERCLIVQVSKEKGTYKIEDLKRPAKIAQYAYHMLKTNEAVEFINSLRKDNQKEIVNI